MDYEGLSIFKTERNSQGPHQSNFLILQSANESPTSVRDSTEMALLSLQQQWGSDPGLHTTINSSAHNNS